MFDSEERLYALAFAMEELKKDGEEVRDIEENVFNENPDYMHYKIIAEAVYDDNHSPRIFSTIRRILKPVGRLALTGLLIGATVYASGCLANDHGNTTTTSSTSTTTTSTIELTNEVYDYLSEKMPLNIIIYSNH